MECDLVVRGGTVVTAAADGVADVGVRDGTIAQLGGEMRGRREIDASGFYVFPGGVDIHVHLSQAAKPEPGRELWVDDFCTGSQAANAGGITTIGNMTFQWAGERLRDALERDLEAVRCDAMVDYVLHPVLTEPTPAALEEVAGLAAQEHIDGRRCIRARVIPSTTGALSADGRSTRSAGARSSWTARP